MRVMLLIALVLMLLERLWPAHPQPSSRRWVLRAMILGFAGVPLLMLGQATWIIRILPDVLHNEWPGIPSSALAHSAVDSAIHPLALTLGDRHPGLVQQRPQSFRE